MSEKVVNGDSSPHSKFLLHLTSFPVVHDGVNKYKTNPYGAKSLSLANQVLSLINARIYKPISPYLSTPYSYVAPYISQADTLGDSGLSRLESTFPIVKEDTATLQRTVTGYAGYPLELAGQGKDYVMKVWGERYQKHEGKMTPVRAAWAAFDTQVVIVGETASTVAGFVQRKTGELTDKSKAKKQEIENK